jgi:hypothetical protein
MGMQLWGNIAWHPAATAWREADPTAPSPESIEVLSDENGTAAYRLVGAGPNGAPIIARRSGRMQALLVRTLYERLLARLPLGAGTPRFCAFHAEPTGVAWVFLVEPARRRNRS